MALSPTTPTNLHLQGLELSSAAWIDDIADRLPACARESDTPDLLATALSLKEIKSNEDAELAVSYSRDMAVCKREIEAHYKPYTSNAHALHKRFVAIGAMAVGPLEQQVARLDALTVAWNRAERKRIADEQEIERRRVEKAAQDERDRIAAEARAEKERIEREAQEKADKLAAEGKTEEAETVINAAVVQTEAVTEQAAMDVQEVRAAPILMPVAGPSARQAIGSAGGSIRVDYSWEPDCEPGEEAKAVLAMARAAVENPAAFLQYLTLNEKTINPAVRAQGKSFKAPGIRVIEVDRLTKRGTK